MATSTAGPGVGQPGALHLAVARDRVHAHYDAESYYRVDKIWSVSQLFIPALRQLHPEPWMCTITTPTGWLPWGKILSSTVCFAR
jgi:hypothetical protein